MYDMRQLAFKAAWGCWTALFGLAIPVLWIFGTPPKQVRLISRLWARGSLAILRLIVGLTYQVQGRANIPLGPKLIISNHQSTWETLAALVLFPDLAIVAKHELSQIPVMGWYLKQSPMILIDRSSSSRALRHMVQQSRTALSAGRSVLIFPEGGRRPVGEPLEFKRGVELLYRSLGIPVLPMVVNSGNFWSPAARSKKTGTITASCLQPISPGLSAGDFLRTAVALMASEKAAIGA